MRKRIIPGIEHKIERLAADWLDLEALAEVEVTSEDPEYPIGAALLPDMVQGWRAGAPGKQLIRLLFKQPQPVHGVQLSFVETAVCRTQEYVLRISHDNGLSYTEVVRQQWNFSPSGANAELEEHVIDMPAVTVIELSITPDINDPSAIATLEKLQVS